MEKIAELLEQLAKQLGVTIEYLWTTLVRQQYVEGIAKLIMAVIGVIAVIAIACMLPRMTKFCVNKKQELASDRRENGTGYEGSYHVSSNMEDFYSALSIAVPIVGAVALIIIVIFSICSINVGIQQLLNPDYFALKEVLDTISGAMQ